MSMLARMVSLGGVLTFAVIPAMALTLPTDPHTRESLAVAGWFLNLGAASVFFSLLMVYCEKARQCDHGKKRSKKRQALGKACDPEPVAEDLLVQPDPHPIAVIITNGLQSVDHIDHGTLSAQVAELQKTLKTSTKESVHA